MAKSNNNANKFNRSITASGATPPLGYFPIKQFRFKTEQHPVLLDQDRCSHSIEVNWSQQELLMISGLTNCFQCDEREAIRIALYEGQRIDAQELMRHSSAAKAGSTEKGHEGRNTSKRIQLTRSEKENLIQSASTYKIKQTELLRLIVIAIARGIRTGSITRLTNSAQISQIELFREWSRSHKITESKLKALKAAASKAWSEAQELAYTQYEKEKEQNKRRKLYRSSNPGIGDEALDLQIDQELYDHLERFVQRYISEQKLNEHEEKIFRLMIDFDLSREEAETVQKEIDEDNAPISEEEWIAIEAWLAELRQEEENIVIQLRLESKFGEGLKIMNQQELKAAREKVIEELAMERERSIAKLNKRMMRRMRKPMTIEKREDLRLQALIEKNLEID